MANSGRVRLDPYKILRHVHWRAGGIGVLQVDLPEGVGLLFDPASIPIGPLANGEHLVRADLAGSVNELQLSGSTVLANLYDVVETLWIIDSVVFPDSPFSSEAEYEAYKAGYVPPDLRFQEVVDVRTLGSDVRAVPPIDITPPSAWPPDGTWATWAHYDGFGPLPPPGEPFWGLGQHKVASEFSRNAIRAIWIFDFERDRLNGDTVSISDPAAEHDDNLASYAMQFALRLFSRNVTLMRSGLTLMANEEPGYSAIRTAPYDQAGTLVNLNRTGFL